MWASLPLGWWRCATPVHSTISRFICPNLQARAPPPCSSTLRDEQNASPARQAGLLDGRLFSPAIRVSVVAFLERNNGYPDCWMEGCSRQLSEYPLLPSSNAVFRT